MDNVKEYVKTQGINMKVPLTQSQTEQHDERENWKNQTMHVSWLC